MKIYTTEELNRILELHKNWVASGHLEGERANLSDADLSDADLSNADLWRANLSNANLSEANLSGANLSGANLWRANLWRANLSGANLNNIKNKFIFTFQIGQHFAYYCDNLVKIGCQEHELAVWIKKGEDIGKKSGYSEADIKNYMLIIKTVKKLIKEQ